MPYAFIVSVASVGVNVGRDVNGTKPFKAGTTVSESSNLLQ